MNTAATAALGAIPAAETSDRQKIKAIVAASSGNLVEWYDFYAYAFDLLRLGLPRRTLNEKMQRYGLSRGEFTE